MTFTDNDLKLSGQRALWGAIVPGLRSVSAEFVKDAVRWLCVFESIQAKELWWEELSDAAGEVIADFPEMIIDEEYSVVPPGQQMDLLKCLLFLRYEPETEANN